MCGGNIDKTDVDVEIGKVYSSGDEEKVTKLQARVRGNNARKNLSQSFEKVDDFPKNLTNECRDKLEELGEFDYQKHGLDSLTCV